MRISASPFGSAHEGLRMPRMARLVIPGYPHHITQRGCRRQQTFFEPADYRAYMDLVASRKTDAGVDIWGYCLMPNHVHLIAVPLHESSLAKLFRTVHRKYSLQVNAAHDWRGHLWQERFDSSSRTWKGSPENSSGSEGPGRKRKNRGTVTEIVVSPTVSPIGPSARSCGTGRHLWLEFHLSSRSAISGAMP